MSTATEHDQEREPVGTEVDGPEHICCCNDQEAVCGADLGDYEGDCVPGCTEHPTCALCDVLYESTAWRCRFCGEGWII